MEWLTSKPAEIFNMDIGRLEVGAPADLACFDLQNEKVISKEMLHSKSSNTPFIGWKIYGDTYFTIVDGQVVYQEEN